MHNLNKNTEKTQTKTVTGAGYFGTESKEGIYRGLIAGKCRAGVLVSHGRRRAETLTQKTTKGGGAGEAGAQRETAQAKTETMRGKMLFM